MYKRFSLNVPTMYKSLPQPLPDTQQPYKNSEKMTVGEGFRQQLPLTVSRMDHLEMEPFTQTHRPLYNVPVSKWTRECNSVGICLLWVKILPNPAGYPDSGRALSWYTQAPRLEENKGSFLYLYFVSPKSTQLCQIFTRTQDADSQRHSTV